MTSVMVAMSGGVDSSAAALLLIKQGFKVSGATIKTGYLEADAACENASEICRSLGIEHFVFDLSESFDKNVVRPFIDSYLAGTTPNPCVLCNRTIKFGAFVSNAQRLGYQLTATGHYAKLVCHGGYKKLALTDNPKDQSYMLYGLSQSVLSKLIFPLAELSKKEVREIAAAAGLACADKPDSQEICFTKKHADFIEDKSGKSIPGNFIYTDGSVLGRHNGIINYTVGQRKGLKISFKEPLYVISIDPLGNTVTLGESERLFSRSAVLSDVNFCYPEEIGTRLSVHAKIRYHAPPAEAFLHSHGDLFQLRFKDPQRAVTPGQAAVFYKDGFLLGGGTIKETLQLPIKEGI